jgi:hypothetical protein
MTRSRAATRSRSSSARRARRKGIIKWTTATFAAVAAVVGALGAMTSLFDWVERRLDPPSPPPKTIDARVLAVDLRRTGEPLADYLHTTRQPLTGLSRRERFEPGLVFAVRVRLQGATGKAFPLQWTLYDVEAQVPLSDLYRQEAVTFTPESQSHARTWPIWVPYPPEPGRYRLDVVLADAKRQPVDERSSQPFRLDSIPPIPDV